MRYLSEVFLLRWSRFVLTFPLTDISVPPVEACHSIIDELKARVPIWKKEVYDDGSSWKANKEFTVPKLG